MKKNILVLLVIVTILIILTILSFLYKNKDSATTQMNISSTAKVNLDLTNTKWRIVGFNGKKVDGYMNFSDKNVALKLCNLINAKFTQRENILNIKEGLGTKMFCENTEMKAEEAFNNSDIFNIVNPSKVNISDLKVDDSEKLDENHTEKSSLSSVNNNSGKTIDLKFGENTITLQKIQ